MDLIRYATIGGTKYPINTHFKVAIECDRIINDPEIDDFERSIGLVTTLFGEVPFEHINEAVDKATIFLGGVSEEEKQNKRMIDFTQHWDLIYSAFMGQYNIDLNTSNMHYQEFIMLLKGVKNTALSDVIELLLKNPSEEKDIKTRRQLIETQNRFKIKKEAPKVNSAFLDLLSKDVKGGKE